MECHILLLLLKICLIIALGTIRNQQGSERMKRYSVAVILGVTASLLAIGVVLGLLAARFLTGRVLEDGVVLCLVLTVPFAFMYFTRFANRFLFPIAKKTMDKGLKANGFGDTYTYTSYGYMRIYSILSIDKNTGRVAYTSALSPFKFQMTDAREMTKIRSGHDKGPFGGTRFVFFEFYLGNERFCFPTFASRNYLALESSNIRESIADADYVCSLLLKFNPDGYLTADKKDKIGMPFIKIGIYGAICATIAVFVTVATLISEVVVSTNVSWKENMLNGIPVYVLAFIGIALETAGIIFGIKGLKEAKAAGPVRGLGFSKTAVTMSSILMAVTILSMLLFIFG